jgi:hypothetical protein
MQTDSAPSETGQSAPFASAIPLIDGENGGADLAAEFQNTRTPEVDRMINRSRIDLFAE